MKKLVVALIAMFAVGAMQAQNLKFGVRAAYDYTSKENWHNKAGFNVGALCNILVAKGFYVEPGLTFFYNTMSVDYGLDIYKPTLRNPGLRIPLNFGFQCNYNPAVSFALYTGPQVNYGLSLKMYRNGGELGGGDSRDSNFIYDLYDDDNNKRFELQWGAGFRAILKKQWFAEAGVAVGLTEISKTPDNLNAHSFNFSIGVGYLF